MSNDSLDISPEYSVTGLQPLLHPLNHPLWRTCPLTGKRIVADQTANLQVRYATLAEAQSSKAVQDDEREACEASLIYWLNAFVWTFQVKWWVDAEGREMNLARAVPFISWPVQDFCLNELVECVTKGIDAIIDKSREMGASWLVIALACWYWLFHDDSHILFASRIEDLVDTAGDPDTLFWKFDFILQNLPWWMLPCPLRDLTLGNRKNRRDLQIVNPLNRSTVRGTASHAHIGRGGRRRLIVFDEMSAMDNQEASWNSAADTTSCRIGNSTPLGPGTQFTKLRNKGLKLNNPKVITLMYWDHPAKGKGREPAVDNDGTITSMAGRQYQDTPWLRWRLTRGDAIDIAQNVMADHIGSGETFFTPAIITQHMRKWAMEPTRCELEETNEGWGFTETESGRWFVWFELDEFGRPDQNTNYCAFSDVSAGRGSSNTTIAVMDRETGFIGAEFVDAYVSHQDLAKEVAVSGEHVFGGQVGWMFYGWEVNGPGESFYHDMLDQDYPFLYRKRLLGQVRDRRTMDYGWRSDRRGKRILCAGLQRAMGREEVRIPSRPGLEEALEYVYFDDGSIGPGTLLDKTTGARESHGDRVIGYAGAVFMRREAPHFEPESESYPEGSYGDLLDHADVWNASG